MLPPTCAVKRRGISSQDRRASFPRCQGWWNRLISGLMHDRRHADIPRRKRRSRLRGVRAGVGDRTLLWFEPPTAGCSPRSVKNPESMTMLDDALSGQGAGSTMTRHAASLLARKNSDEDS